MLNIKDYLIVLVTNTSHKAHLLSCALRCSSKLQEIQSLKNFVSIAIQGTQEPIYTNTYCFCIFLIFQIFYFYFYENQNKKKTEKQLNKNIKKHTKYKTRLTQKKKKKKKSKKKK